MTFAGLFFLAGMLTVGLVVIFRGGVEERAAAVVIAIAAAVSPLVTSRDYAGLELGLVFVDLVLLIVLAVIALRSASFWPMWAAGFQICGLAGHIAAAKSQAIVPAAYAETLIIWSYAVLAALLVGTLMEGRRHHGRG